MTFFQDPEFGDRIITLMAALVLVLQIAAVGQRWLVSSIRIFAAQSFLLAAIAGIIAYFNHASHIYIAALLTLILKAALLPWLLERLVKRIEIRREIEPLINAPLSILITGCLTLVGYVVAESFYHPEETSVREALGHNTLAVAIALFLIGFFTMLNRRKALSQVLGLLSLENGLFLAAISLTYGMPLIVELGIFLMCSLRSWFSGFLSSECARRSIRWTSASFGSCESRRTYDFTLAPDRSSRRQSSGLLSPKAVRHGGGQSGCLRRSAMPGRGTGVSGASERPRFALGRILLRGRSQRVGCSLDEFRLTGMFHLCRRLFSSGREKRDFSGGAGIAHRACHS